MGAWPLLMSKYEIDHDSTTKLAQEWGDVLGDDEILGATSLDRVSMVISLRFFSLSNFPSFLSRCLIIRCSCIS